MPTIWSDLMGSQVRYVGRRHRTRVIESGEGPPLILIHGVGGHAEAYSRNVTRLGRNFRAMAIDLLWHGYSDKPAFSGDAVPSYAAQIIDLLDAEGIERAHIEGESLGGWVGLWLALEHPDRVDRLVLNTTAGVKFAESHHANENPGQGRELLRTRSLEAIKDPNRETIRKRLEWLMASPDRVTDELVEVRLKIYSDPAIQPALRTVFENSFGFGTGPSRQIPADRLKDVKTPTLVFWTDQNPGSGPDVGRLISSLLPNSEFYCMADAAHWPQWEHPEEHDSVVSEFLGRVAGSGR